MPIKKKKNNTFIKVLIWAIVLTIIALMAISFAPVQHMNEIVVHP